MGKLPKEKTRLESTVSIVWADSGDGDWPDLLGASVAVTLEALRLVWSTGPYNHFVAEVDRNGRKKVRGGAGDRTLGTSW